MKRYRGPVKTIAFSLPIELITALEEMRSKIGVSRSELIREMIHRAVESGEPSSITHAFSADAPLPYNTQGETECT